MLETLETSVPDSGPGDDLDSVIGAAWDAHDTPETAAARDERGRFASSREPVEGEAETEITDQPEEAAPEPEAPAIEAPASWSADEKAKFEGLSREVQETILRRERDIDRALSERAGEAQEMSAWREVLEPYKARHAMTGLSQREAVSRLLAVEQMLHSNPDQAFPELMRAYGWDPRRLGLPPTQPQYQQAPQQPLQDPRVDSLLREMETRRQHDTLAQIKAFSDDPAHAHFEEVRSDMGRLIAANPDMDLKRAYKIAVAASDSVQAKIAAAAAKQRAEADRKAAAEKADKAKRAAVSVRDRSPSSGGHSSSGKSLEEQLYEAFGG